MKKKKSVITRYWGNHKLVYNLDKIIGHEHQHQSIPTYGLREAAKIMSDDLLDSGNKVYWGIKRRVV